MDGACITAAEQSRGSLGLGQGQASQDQRGRGGRGLFVTTGKGGQKPGGMVMGGKGLEVTGRPGISGGWRWLRSGAGVGLMEASSFSSFP